ncbi:uncharacterized protein MKZ38_002088 [Zalerion maritima]|uniref:Transcription factor IIIC 90kDa subunit N-terminal domain-containing protein n=1 Tax=Zalerion maritima TaxID=339359 RepID=A0AAD5RYW3_9PEZI|nr:uncharacterized protein MKZ38_002088 [Zalerion maritima]
MTTKQTFIPTAAERAINELQERILPLESITIRGRPLTQHAVAFSCDCELAVAVEDAIQLYFPQYPPLDEESDEELSDGDEQEEEGEEEQGQKKPPQEADEEIILPNGKKVNMSQAEQKRRKRMKPRKQFFFKRPHEDPDAPMIEWKEAHELDNQETTNTQFRRNPLLFPVLLADPSVNYPLFTTMKAKYPLWHLREWEGDVARRAGDRVDESELVDEDEDDEAESIPRETDAPEKLPDATATKGSATHEPKISNVNSNETQGDEPRPAESHMEVDTEEPNPRATQKPGGEGATETQQPTQVNEPGEGSLKVQSPSNCSVNKESRSVAPQNGQPSTQDSNPEGQELPIEEHNENESNAWGTVLSYGHGESDLGNDDMYASDSSEEWNWPENYKPRPKQGNGIITSKGGSLNHVVALGWSPNTVGFNGRQVLSVLSGSGVVTMYGESPSRMRTKVRSPDQLHDFALWEILWGVGGRFVIPGGYGPTDPHKPHHYGGDYITSFAWSKLVDEGKALLAYMNDDDEIVVIQVQCITYKKVTRGDYIEDAAQWIVEEAGRFDASGPHMPISEHDPDFHPTGTNWALTWTNWNTRGDSRTCLLTYISNNYIGFRKVTIDGEWEEGCLTDVKISERDEAGMCRYLYTDAFIEFEDKIWESTTGGTVRGFLATPFEIQPFEVPMHNSIPPHIPKHHIDDCETTYPASPISTQNPITGLVIHPPPAEKNAVPYYTLSRASATQTNEDWWDTNVPVPERTDDDKAFGRKPTNTPGWCEEVVRRSQMVLPDHLQELTLAHEEEAGSDGDEEEVADEAGEEGEEDDVEDASAEGGSRAVTIGGEAQPRKEGAEGLEDEDERDILEEMPMDVDNDDALALELATVTRGRSNTAKPGEDGSGEELDMEALANARSHIHGMAYSPGRGVGVILLTQQWTKKPSLGGWYKSKSRIIFGQKNGRGPMLEDQLAGAEDDAYQALTTESKMVEWMYGGGPMPRGIVKLPDPDVSAAGLLAGGGGSSGLTKPLGTRSVPKESQHAARVEGPLRKVFKDYFRKLTCMMCGGKFRSMGDWAICRDQHIFDTCATSGVPIQIPGPTITCAVCRGESYVKEYLVGMLPDAVAEIDKGMKDGRCGACGGKLVA